MTLRLRFDPAATIHISQALAGFALLKQEGRLDYTLQREPIARHFGHNQVVLAQLENGECIAYDTHDSGDLFLPPDVFDTAVQALRVRAYYRRSYRAGGYGSLASAALQQPLGMNYHVSCPGNPYNCMRPADLKNIRNPLLRHVLLRKGLAKLPFGRLSDRQFYPAAFAQPAKHETNGSVLFLTRTWFPLEEHDPACTHAGLEKLLREMPALATIWEMDQNRAAVIRLLRREYGENAVAGFARSRFAEAFFSDLIAPQALTRRAAYLQTMRRAAVCLTTVGLHRSTGWKMGEYVAAAQAIVCEPLHDTMPGAFLPGQNYLTFRRVEEALRQTELLLQSRAAAQTMREANAAYYESHLRPDAMIARTLPQYTTYCVS